MVPESSSLTLQKETKATKLHYLAVVVITLAKLGDSVEFTLPAIITQPVSCELGLSKEQEHILALAQYTSAAVFSLCTILFLTRYPRRPIVLFSLYLSVISVVICAIVPDYISLLLSRI